MEQVAQNSQWILGIIGIAMVLGFSALGSAFGVGACGMAAVGAWKRCYLQNKPAPFLLVAFIGAPLTQCIYGFILMNSMYGKVSKFLDPTAWQYMNPNLGIHLLGVGLFGGLAIGLSSYMQGKIGASASDALGETGKGFGQYIMAMGMAETVALFAMVFLMGVVG